MPPPWVRTLERREKFLDVLAATRTVVLAAAAAGASTCSFYIWRKEDPSFAADWDAALANDFDAMDCMIVRRSLEALGRRVMARGLELSQAAKRPAKRRRRARAAKTLPDRGNEKDMTDGEIDARISELRRKAGTGDAGCDQEAAPGAGDGAPEIPQD